jgi:hypothetical protein
MSAGGSIQGRLAWADAEAALKIDPTRAAVTSVRRDWAAMTCSGILLKERSGDGSRFRK